MTGAAVALLLALAVVVLLAPGRPAREVGAVHPARMPPVQGSAGGVRPGTGRRRWFRRARPGSESVEELPLFVRQMAGLLRAGRPPSVLWADLEGVYAEDDTAFAVRARPAISAVRRASAMGLSVPEALRETLGPTPQDDAGGPVSEAFDRLWVDLAGCLTVAERSGAPLATILDQYAAQLEADLVGRAARETALAGPRATVVLLTWLPVVGLLLGVALGVQPLDVLVGDPLGRWALVMGVLLMIASRAWSGRLVRRAEAAR